MIPSQPSPTLLDVLYRIGAYPLPDVVDEFDMVWLAWWFRTPLCPVVLQIRETGSQVQGLIAELLALSDRIDALNGVELPAQTATSDTINVILYQFEVGPRQAILIDREVTSMELGLTAQLQLSALITPWFVPPRDFYGQAWEPLHRRLGAAEEEIEAPSRARLRKRVDEDDFDDTEVERPEPRRQSIFADDPMLAQTASLFGSLPAPAPIPEFSPAPEPEEPPAITFPILPDLDDD